LTQTTPLPFPASEGTTTVFKPAKQELEVEFGEQFSKLLGKFVSVLPQIVIAGIIAFAAGYVIQHINF